MMKTGNTLANIDPRRNYPEDAHLENGNYFCECYECKETFVGHKRRGCCKLCLAKAEIIQ